MISKGFLKSSIVYTIGGALPMVAGIVLLPFYTNNLNDLHFLQVAFYISIALLFQILFTFSLDTFFGVKYTQLTGKPEKQKAFIGTTAILLILIGLFWLLVMALSGNALMNVIFRSDYEMEFWPYGFYSILTAFFNSYFKTCTNALIYLRKPVLFLSMNLINFIFTLLISIGGLKLFPESIIGPMYGRLLSGLIIFVMAHIVFARFGIFKFEKEFLPEIKQFCVPFLFFVLSAWILSQIDRFMLQSYIDKVDLNTYDLVLKCFFGIEFLQNSLSAVIFPKLYEIWNKQERLHTTKESNRYFNVFTAVNIVQLIVFCIAIPILYKLLITKQSFYDAASYIGILAAGYGLRSILNFYLSTILFSKNTLTLLKIFGTSALFQIAITYFTAKQFGLIGVIYAGILTKVLQVVLSAVLTQKIFVYEFNFFKIYMIPVLYLMVNVAQFYFFPGYDVRFYLAQLLVFTVLFYFIFRKEIKQVLIQFKIVSA
jgi:O-antigen/teichoic acid export membrane protein